MAKPFPNSAQIDLDAGTILAKGSRCVSVVWRKSCGPATSAGQALHTITGTAMKYSNLFHWYNYPDKDRIAATFCSQFQANLGSFPLSCDLSLSLCKNQHGDSLVHLFVDAPTNATLADGKKLWEKVHEYLKASGCPDPQGWDELPTASVADIPRSLADVQVFVVSSIRREGVGALSDSAAKEPAGTSSISVVCTSCEKKLRADAKLAGKRIKCPKCGQVINVPGQAAMPSESKPSREVERAAHEPVSTATELTCSQCSKVFPLSPKWPPRGCGCPRCRREYCYDCIKSSFAKAIADYPARAAQFVVDQLDVRGLAELAQTKVGNSTILPVMDKDGYLPCPNCFTSVWKREAVWFGSGRFSRQHYQGIVHLAKTVQAQIDAGSEGVGEKLQAANDGGRLLWATWRSSLDEHIQLAGADLSGLQLTGANLAEADLRGANLAGTKAYSIRLQNADLSGASLKNCNWLTTWISRDSKFCDVDLSGGAMTIFLDGDWTGANFSNAKLTLMGVMSETRLQDADFTGCTVKPLGPELADTVNQFRALLTPQQKRQLTTDLEQSRLFRVAVGCLTLLLILAICTVPIGVIVYLAVQNAEQEKERRAQLTGVDKVPVWMDYLKGDDPEQREEAVRELVKLGPEAKAATSDLASIVFTDKRREVRLAAITVLGAIGEDAQRVEGVLLGLRRDPDKNLRDAAGLALEKIHGGGRPRTPEK